MLKIIEKEGISAQLKKIVEKKRSVFDSKTAGQVKEIINSVKANGDAALRELTSKYDKVELDEIKVPEDEIKTAHSKADKEFLSALRMAIKNITEFHKKQKPEEWFEQIEDDAILGMRSIPIEKVGIYVPGGRAAYPSTVLMNAIPAKVAGVSKIVMVSPPKISPYVLAAAAELGIFDIYQIGGAQAIAALAYGTETVPKVDKIVGPGNIYVTLAKKEVFGIVGIDSLAGPSDVLIIADEDSEPSFIAADLLAQSEHDPEAQSILITDSKEIAERVNAEIKKQLPNLKRKEILEKSLKENAFIFLVSTFKEAVEIADQLAPEHLEVLSSPPQKMLEKVKNAGAVFMGPYSPVALGDYIAGPNHVLPTAGTARFSSPLTVYDFIKRQSILGYTKPALNKVRKSAELLAKLEGLDAHARSISIRFS
ncbi:MAG: histidinol dehydrogenase [Candidatus Margulisiibacteriota bacterium]